MRVSIGSRIWQVAALAALMVALLCGVFYWSLRQTQSVDRWVDHTHTVLRKLSSHALSVTQAEAAQRGFLLTDDPAFLAAYRTAKTRQAAHFAELTALLADNLVQKARFLRVGAVVEQRLAVSDRALALARAGDRAGAVALIRQGEGAALMQQFTALTQDMAATEKQLLADRQRLLQRNDHWLKFVAFGGGILVIAVLMAASWSIVLRIKRPLDRLLHGIAALADDRTDYAVPVTTRDEVGRVTEAFNQMAERLVEARRTRESAERALAQSNTELRRRSDELVNRGAALDALSRMAQRLQAVGNEAEFARVVQRFAPQILTGTGGALYFLNNSRNLMILVSSWLCDAAVAPYFGPDDCWALRRGQVHAVTDGAADIVCHHLGDQANAYTCTPLLAHGETLGLLYLERVAEGDGARLPLLAENIALALANFRLQQTLREQSIRDPLTGLFNRRYLEEALRLEIARGARSQTSLSVVMIDVDHFKRFNDQFGHDAGDALLRAVARLLPNQVRAGDILCRYGGEELMLILPGADLDMTMVRAETIRRAIETLDVHHGGQPLGRVTASIGVATYPQHGETLEALVGTADAALYRAKAAGRNRVERATAEDVAA